MKNSWTRTFRRLAAAAVVAGTTSFSAVGYAQLVSGLLAADCPTEPEYDDGWQAGDNGGYGFGPWDFSGTYNSAVQQTMDTTNPFNDLGEAWTLFNANGPNYGTDNPPSGGTDIARSGRLLPGPMHVNQTVSLTVDNPTERGFWRGWTVQLNSGGASSCYNGDNCTTPAYDPGSVSARIRVGTFENGTNGAWFASGAPNPGLADTDTDAGVRLDITLKRRDTYELTMTPLDNPGNAQTVTGTVGGSGAINWIEIQLYNTDSDANPVGVTPMDATDFYIGCMSSVPEPGSAALLVLGASGLLGLGRRNRKE
jgi:hypothetical protein